jgi:mono/diheme cytochrome c family protein
MASLPLADDAGRRLTKKCATCHGEDGHGSAAKAGALKIDPALLDFSRPEAASLSAEELRKIVAEGKGKMPAYGKKLTAPEIDALVSHVQTLRPVAK